VEPARPEHVGHIARGLKALGNFQLRLVRPCDYRGERARQVAFQAADVLDSAAVYHSLSSALEDCQFIVGTGENVQGLFDEPADSRRLRELVAEKRRIVRRTAVVFGRESHGLHRDELAQCHLLCRIPQGRRYPSLSLSQAVLVLAYELAPLTADGPVSPPAALPSAETTHSGELRALRRNLAIVLDDLGLARSVGLKARMFERLAYQNQTDIRLLHSIVSRLARRIRDRKQE
jgi:TrmH family RNA methyltransferase